MRLAGKVAVVTGATSEIGEATALRLAAEGAVVAAVGGSPAKVEALAAALRAVGPGHQAHALDLTRPEVVEAFFAGVAASLGPTAILVNGAAWRPRGSFLETDYADWQRTFAVSLDSYFLCGQAAARQMLPHRWGRIVHIGSIAGAVLMVPFTAYAAAKAAVHALAKAMAVDLGPHGITVNVVAPGVVESRYNQANLTPTMRAKRLERIAMGRLATPEECAAAVASLVAPDMGYVTGQVLYVDGGFLSAGVIAR